MRLQHMYQNRITVRITRHTPSWDPLVQPPVALESYLEEVRLQLAKIEIAKPKNNHQGAER